MHYLKTWNSETEYNSGCQEFGERGGRDVGQRVQAFSCKMNVPGNISRHIHVSIYCTVHLKLTQCHMSINLCKARKK